MDTSKNKVHFFTIFIFPFKYFGWDGHNQVAITPQAAVKPLTDGRTVKWRESLFSIGDKEQKAWTAESLEELRKEILEYSESSRSGAAPAVLEKQKDKIDEKFRPMREHNEWYYFHPYVREMIFRSHLSDDGSMRFLTRTDYTTLCVQVVDDDNPPRHISAHVKSIDLHLYDNQIGLLSITAESENQHTFEELLRFNDVARRVYPPFLGFYRPERDDEKAAIMDMDLSPTSAARKGGGILPNTVTLTGKSRPIQQVFESITLPQTEPFLSKIILKLLDPLQFKPWEEQKLQANKIYFDSFTDDRMFIVSYCAEPDLAQRLSPQCCGHFNYESSDEWYQFLFVDGKTMGVANESMKRELIRKHTNGRWAEYRTLYGMSRYSFVMLGDGKDFCKRVLYHHMKGAYYQLALIILFQRAMLLKFSEDVKELTKMFKRSRPSEQFFRRADKLYGEFIAFTNRYWHSEVTPQEQGIELYDKWTRLLEHGRLFEDVNGEIQDLALYVRNAIEHRTSDRIKALTRVLVRLTWMLVGLTVLLLVLTIWLAFIGEGELPQKRFWLLRPEWLGYVKSDPSKWILIVVIAVLFLILVVGILWFSLNRFKRLFGKSSSGS
ncbi:MAG: hypothetical protein QME66_11890 [Candidatus Eisenbacteria bacterium]|nr:hypothetical protein [Candidatus Eisenbacteria bacterium]